MSLFFLRPQWFLCVIPVLVLGWLLWKKKLGSREWVQVIDPVLLPYLLQDGKGKTSNWFSIFWILLSLLIITALAGPAWKKIPLPVFNQQSALVILLDLSQSMDAGDIKPSRLARARLKIADLLKTRKEGQTALIAYAGTAYTVTPLTDDTQTIQSLLSSLTTNIMPSQGSRTDLAIEKAIQLFNNAAIYEGDIWLVTDGVNTTSRSNILKIKGLDSYRVSILNVATEQGAPIPSAVGGYIKDKNGSIVIAKSDFDSQRQIARKFNGVFSKMTTNDDDIQLLNDLIQNRSRLAEHKQTDFKADRWQEEGVWILLLITPLVSLAFRKGVVFSLTFLLIPVLMPQPVRAMDWPEWNSLWLNENQRAQQMLEQGEAGKAAELFNRSDWKAASHYKAKQYEQALQQFESQKSVDSIYNKGNTLAKMKRYEDALGAYDQVLLQQPEHQDASYNKKLVEDAIKKQQQQQKDNQQQSDKNKQQQQDEEKKSEQSKNNQPSNDESEQSQEQSEKQEQSKKSEPQQEQEQQQQQDKKQSEQSLEEKPEQEEIKSAQQEKEEKLSEQAEAQWLRRIPDDPGGLLRNKFKHQYSRQKQPINEEEQW